MTFGNKVFFVRKILSKKIQFLTNKENGDIVQLAKGMPCMHKGTTKTYNPKNK